MLAIQKDSTNWLFIPHWLASPQLQIQFFGAQCLLIRINRDWDALEEDEQVQLRDLIGKFGEQPNLSAAAKNKLQEALVKVMERAFISGWWKDPIGDLLNSRKCANFTLLAQIAGMSSSSGDSETNGKSVYAWHHEIKAHSNQIIEAILKQQHNQIFDDFNGLLECIKNWTIFGAFNFTQIERILPLLTRTDGEEVDENVVDCLVEICELVTRDAAEEARKARHLIPYCLNLPRDTDPIIITKLTVSLAEECSNFLVQSCHDQQVQMFLGLLLQLTKGEGILGVDDQTSQMTLNAWYLLTEMVDSDLPPSNASILISLFANSLAPILLQKATMPASQIWAKLQRDLQQQFLQIRREFLDTLLYVQRVLKTLQSPFVLLEILLSDLKQAGISGAEIETRLRALMIVAEEEDSAGFDEVTGESLAWTPVWQNLASLIFTSPSITAEAVNAKLAISLIGAITPLMKGTAAADEAVEMLLGQLQGNLLVREECLGALQQAADAEIPLLTDPQIISNLLVFLSSCTDSSRPKLLKLLSRLISDLSDESQRWNAFNSLLQSCSNYPLELAQVLRTPFNFKNENNLIAPSPYKTCLKHLKQSCDLVAGEALLAAWLALSGSNWLPLFETDSADPSEFLSPYLNSNDQQFLLLGCKLLAAWVYGMSRVNPGNCLKLLENASVNQIIRISDPPEDAIEAILDSWIHLRLIESPVISDLYEWILQRISIGQLSVPLLRSMARFLCFLIESANNKDENSSKFFPTIQIVFSVGISGKIGRSGMEILARVLHEISLQQPNFFRSALNQLINSEALLSVNENDKKIFLRNIGAAHTIKKFKSVLVEFCLQSRGIIQ